MIGSPFPEAAVRTLIAPYWKLWLAYLFGRRIETEDSGSTIICYA